MPPRVCPPIWVNVPPTNSRLPDRATVLTTPFVDSVAKPATRLPVATSSSTRPLAFTPPMLLKAPPT